LSLGALLFLLKTTHDKYRKTPFIGIRKEYLSSQHRNITELPSIAGDEKQRLHPRRWSDGIDEQNTIAHSTITLTGATVYKKHRVFEKQLTD